MTGVDITLLMAAVFVALFGVYYYETVVVALAQLRLARHRPILPGAWGRAARVE